MRFTVLGATLLLLMMAQHVSGRAAEDLSVGTDKQLLVDDFAIATTKHVRRVLGKVEKANDGKPIFDARFYGTVLHDEGRFKLWYRKPGSEGYGYAESRDGIRFEKRADVTGINFAGDFNLAVELNRADAKPQRRFLGGYDAPGMAAGIAFSADGIKWVPYNDGKPVTFRAADCHNQILWDPLQQIYRLFTRTDYGSGGGPLADTVAKGFEVRGTRAMVKPALDDDPTRWDIVRQWYFNREGEDEFLRRQVYSMTVWIHEGIYFALMSVYEHPGDVSEGREPDHVTRHERDVMEFYIATSRDCDDWDLTWVYAGQPLVPRGPDGSFDKDTVFPSSTIVTHDDKHWLYYSGNNERHGTAELKPPVWFESDRAIGVAMLPLDRFVGWHAGAREGIVETKPFVLDGSQLSVNVDASQGSVVVEVLDAEGRVMDGYGADRAIMSERVDGLRLQPKWTGKTDLSELVGKTVRLRFRLTLADLFAFHVTE